jgi:hypothetical protein
MLPESVMTLEERQAEFDAKEYFMHDRITGVRYCDIMTPKQFQQMKDNMERKHG